MLPLATCCWSDPCKYKNVLLIRVTPLQIARKFEKESLDFLFFLGKATFYRNTRHEEDWSQPLCKFFFTSVSLETSSFFFSLLVSLINLRGIF